MNKRASFIIILRCGFVTRKKLPTKVKKVVNIYKDKNLYSWKWIPSSFYFFNFIFGKYLLVLNKIGVDQTLLMSHYSKLPLVWFKWRFHFYNHLFFERHLLEHTFIINYKSNVMQNLHCKNESIFWGLNGDLYCQRPENKLDNSHIIFELVRRTKPKLAWGKWETFMNWV